MRQRVNTFDKPNLAGGVCYWPSGASPPPAAATDDGGSIGSWPSLRRARNRIIAQVAVANGEPRSLITARAAAAEQQPPLPPPPIYETSHGGSSWREREAERLANWTRQALSCESVDEPNAQTAAPVYGIPAPLPKVAASTPPPRPPAALAWSARALAKRIRSEQLMDEVLASGESRSLGDPRLVDVGGGVGGVRGASAPHYEPPSPKSQNSLKWATMVRQIQKNK